MVYARVIRTAVFLVKTMSNHVRFAAQSFVYRIFLPALTDPAAAADGRRELALHGLMELFAAPSFALEMFTTYDCALAAPDLLADLLAGLAAIAATEPAGRVAAADEGRTMAQHSLQVQSSQGSEDELIFTAFACGATF